MKHQNKAAKNHKSRERIQKREFFNAQSAKGKKERIKTILQDETNLVVVANTLKNDNRKRRQVYKRPGPEKYLEVFSFIPQTSYDNRNSIPENYRCRSFNKQRQYIDFIKDFIYPYNFPRVLLWTIFEEETIMDDQGTTQLSPDYEIIQLAKKWICDITCGESFYKKNKGYFTKAEAHYFLVSDIPYLDPLTVIEQYFYAKCIARKLDVRSSRDISRIFSIKFSRDLNHPIVTEFLDFIARSDDFTARKTELGDISDFILTEIKKSKESSDYKQPFSFSGRTSGSVIALANEWHADVIYEQEMQYNLAMERQRMIGQNNKRPIPAAPSHWSGISVAYSRIKKDECIWLFSQLYTVQELLNEGRKMKNCVSSYSMRCASGECSIFHLSCLHNGAQINEDKATLEVSRDRILIQAKTKCNAQISSLTMSIVEKWAHLNNIKMGLL